MSFRLPHSLYVLDLLLPSDMALLSRSLSFPDGDVPTASPPPNSEKRVFREAPPYSESRSPLPTSMHDFEAGSNGSLPMFRLSPRSMSSMLGLRGSPDSLALAALKGKIRDDMTNAVNQTQLCMLQ